MKKWFSILLSAILAASMAACTNGVANSPSAPEEAAETSATAAESGAEAGTTAEESGEDKPFAGETVTVYTHNTSLDGWQPFVDLVLEKTGIIVDGVTAPTNYSDVVTKLSSTLTAGDDSFDIVHVDELLGVTYSAAGYLEPLNDVIEPVKKFYPEDVLERISKGADGNYYLLPQELGAMYFFINNDVMEAAGASIPTNKEEFLEAARLMTNGDVYGYGAAWSKGGQLFNDLIRWMYCFDGDFYDWTNPKSKEALQFMHDLLYTEKVTSEAVLADIYDAENQKIIDGRYGMVFQWAYLADVSEDKWGDSITIAPMPAFTTNKTIVAGWHMAINKNSKKIDAAKEVMKVWASEEGQMLCLQMEGASHSEVLKTPEAIEVSRTGAALAEYSEAGSLSPRPMSEAVNEIMEVTENYAQAYLTNQISLDECAEQATAEMQALLG